MPKKMSLKMRELVSKLLPSGDIPDISLAAAREINRETLASRAKHPCPACDRRLKVNRVKLNPSLIMVLRSLAGLAQDRVGSWVQYERLGAAVVKAYTSAKRPCPAVLIPGALSALCKHGLVENLPLAKGGGFKHGTGLWALTEKGLSFLRGSKIKKAVVVYANRPWAAIRSKEVTVDECMKNFEMKDLEVRENEL